MTSLRCRIVLSGSLMRWRLKERSLRFLLLKKIRSYSQSIRNWRGLRRITLIGWKKGSRELSSWWIGLRLPRIWMIRKLKICISRFIRSSPKRKSCRQSTRRMSAFLIIKFPNKQLLTNQKMTKSKNCIKKFPESKNSTTLSFSKFKAGGRINVRSGKMQKIKTGKNTKNCKRSWGRRNVSGGPKKKNCFGRLTSVKGKTRSLSSLSRRCKPMRTDWTSTSSSLTILWNASTRKIRWAHWTMQESGGSWQQNLIDRKMSLKLSHACKWTRPRRKCKTRWAI